MSLVSLALVLFVVVVFAALFWTIKTFAPQIGQALESSANAALNAEHRAALYAAVKIGLRVAKSHGFEFDQLVAKAIEVASRYLQEHGIAISPQLLADLIQAEDYKTSVAPPLGESAQ